MTTEPKLLEDLKWLGINMVSCANNHAFDYGEGGVLANIRHLDEAGIVHAGTGKTSRRRERQDISIRPMVASPDCRNRHVPAMEPGGEQRRICADDPGSIRWDLRPPIM